MSAAAWTGPPPPSPVDDVLYDRLRVDRREWLAPGRPLDAEEMGTLGSLILEEAWLLDQRRYEDWLELYTDQCLYWVPASSDGDPQREVTLAFDDRRRLGDRIAWLRTGLAAAQIPPSRTVHSVGASVVVATDTPLEVKVRSSLVIHEARTGPARSLAGWTGHVLCEVDGCWRITRKLVQLVDAGSGWRNLTFLL